MNVREQSDSVRASNARRVRGIPITVVLAAVALFTFTFASACGITESGVYDAFAPQANEAGDRSDDNAGRTVADGGATSDARSDAPACLATDIKGRLACIPGLTLEEVRSNPDGGSPVVPAGYRRFELTVDQPADHEDALSAHFAQRLSLLHVSETAPMVLASSGYGLRRNVTEITRAFKSNQLQVEHRFFTPSSPAPPTWKDLTIKQSAADYHRIVTLLKTIYGAHWVNTGVSKGGMTSAYHRRFYPLDLDGTVAYVAPLSYGTADPRYTSFLATVGGEPYADCRSKLLGLQKAVLNRRVEVLEKMEGTYDQLGGKAVALEHAVLEMPFAFWQYTDPGDPDFGCSKIPDESAPIDTLFGFFRVVTQLESYGGADFDAYTPYYYQAATQLGAPAGSDDGIVDLLSYRSTYKPASYAPKNVPTVFDAAAIVDVQTWVKTKGVSLMFVYGEDDPWTAGKFEIGAAKDSMLFVAPGANHGANLRVLAPSDRARAVETLTRWMNAPLVPPPALLPSDPSLAPGDDELASKPRL